ncbi:MAG: Cyclic-di-AMP phosphodiesterase PgpH, partial [Chlamydiae bacterium]|nr:Cyclic-di-AMP phosphodiesterase PgpH [Chlamydiota bacterium]
MKVWGQIMSEDRKALFKKFTNMRHFFIWPDGIGFRLIIGFVMTLIVSIFLHLRETDVDYLELGTPAKRYVVAQVPFEFPDDEAHSVKKQQSVRNIGTIFEIERDDIDRLRLQLEKEILISENLNSETNDKIFQAADLLVKALLDARFADTKTLQAMKKAGLFTLNYEIFMPKSSSEKLPKDVFYSIQKRAFSQARIERDVYEMVMKYFDNQTWQFKEDIQAQNALRKTIVTTVPKPMTPVSTGQKIIAQGEMVTSRHVAQVQSMKAAVLENRKLFQPLTFLGSFILALVFVFITWIYLKIKQPHFLQSSKKLALFSCIVIIALIISKVIERLLVGHTSHLIDIVQYPLFVPFATILIAVLINTELALFATAILAVILTTTLAVDETRFLTINLVASLVCLYSARHLKKRTEIFKITFKGWLACVIVVFSFYFIDDIFFSKSLVQDLISTFIFMFFTAILCIGLLPPLESSFQMMTSITLMEYLDTNHPLLRRFSIEAPGTYQHSLLLSNLVGECAREINANSIFCRAAAMY